MATGYAQYEFSVEQNALIGSLARKMGWVGLFFTVVGLLNLLVTGLLVLAIYRNQLPADWLSQLPPEARSQMHTLPPSNQLWGFALNAGISGLVYLLIGIWTQTAAGSFRRIVDTQGRDISHLMHALSALHKMYSLVYALLVVTLLFFLAAVGLALFSQFAGG